MYIYACVHVSMSFNIYIVIKRNCCLFCLLYCKQMITNSWSTFLPFLRPLLSFQSAIRFHQSFPGVWNDRCLSSTRFYHLTSHHMVRFLLCVYRFCAYVRQCARASVAELLLAALLACKPCLGPVVIACTMGHRDFFITYVFLQD